MSPINTTEAVVGMARKRLWASQTSSIEASSMITMSAVSGCSRSWTNLCSCGSNLSRRWIVCAYAPVASARRFAARPVGEASRILHSFAFKICTMAKDDGGLADAGPAGDHGELASQRAADGVALRLAEDHP